MALDTYDFEGANGALLAGAGITIAGTGTAVHDSSWSVSGATSARFLNNSGSSRIATLATTSTTATTGSFQGFWKVPNPLPPAGVRATVGTLRHASGVAIRVTVTETGVVGIESATGGVFTPVSAALAVDTPFRVTGLFSIGANGGGTSPNNSTGTWKVYTGSTFSTQSGSTVTSSTFNFGTAPIAALGCGSMTVSGTYQYTTFVDYIQYQDGSTTELTVPAGAAAPTVSAGADQYVAAGATATLTGSGTPGSGGGSINGYTWTNTERPVGAATPTIASPGAASTTVTGLVAGVYRFSLIATQSGGGLTSAADEVAIWVYPPSSADVLVYSETHSSGITNEGGATSFVAALNDTNAATKAQWPSNPSGEAIVKTYCPFGPGPISVILDGYYDGTGPVNRSVTWLAEDGTTILTGPVTYALTTTNAGVETAISNSGMTALGTSQANRRALKVRVSDSI